MSEGTNRVEIVQLTRPKFGVVDETAGAWENRIHSGQDMAWMQTAGLKAERRGTW